MDIKELLAKCEELELKEDGIDNVVTGLASLIADDDEWDELGEYIINTSRMYDKFCQPAMKKIKAGKGDEIDWRKIAIEGARMYAREIEPLHLDGDGYKKTAEYLKDYYTNLAGNGKNEELEEKPAEMEKAEYKEMDIKEPEVEKLKEEKDLAETPAEMEQAEYKDMKIEKPEVEPLKEEVAEKIAFKLGDADVEVSNDTKEEFTADEIKEVIEKENPHIFFNDADSYHYIMDFSFEKNGKKYWIESKNIEGDFSKFELNIYEGFNESVAGSLIKELNLLESKEVGNIIPAEMEKAEYGEVKPIKPEVDENGKKAEKELKEGIEDKTVNFMNKPLHYEFFNKRSDGGFVTLEVGKGELKDNDENCYILVGYSANTNQFRFTVIYEDSEKNCDIMDSFLKDDISKADLENLKNAIYDEYNVNEDLDDEKEPTKVTVKVSDVEWDTDDEEVDLPKEFTLTVDHYDDTDLDDEVSDAISDEYGFCHFGFNYIIDGQGVSESRADKIRKGAYKRVKHESLTKDEYQVIVRNVYGENAIIKNASNLANAKKIRDDLKSRLKSSPIYILKDGKIIDESLNEATETDINRMIEKVYGKVGNKKDEYFLQGTTIYQRMEDNGGVKRILDASTKGKLYDLLCELKAYKNFLIDAGKMDESLNEEGAGDFKYQIGDMIKMTRKAQAEGRRLFGADFKVIKGEVIDRFNGGIDMPNVYTVKIADGSEESVAESLVEYWGTKRKKESVGESVKNPIESIHTGRNIYIKLNPEFENISLSELFKIIELGGTEETNSFWRTVIREKRGHITIKRNENESNELIFYPNTWKDKNFKIETVAGVPFEDTFHAYGFAKNEYFEDKTINEGEKTYYLYAGYYELYLTDHKLTPPYMYQAENTDLNQLINDNISEIDDEGEWINPDAAFSTDSATICFDKNIIDELNKTDLFGGEIDMYHDALSDAEFNGEDEDKVKEDYHIYDLSKYYADKNESLNEISLESAKAVNDKRQFNSLKADLKANMTNSEDDREEADKLADKSTKSNKLLQRWKKAKGIEESAQVVVAKFDDGLHEIVKCDKGYFNRYNIKDGKARFTTQCVESLPTALGALKKRFPNASEDINVNESLNEEFKSFKGYKFRGIVNSKTGEIIYSKLSPKGRVLQADIKMNVNDKEDFNNKEIIQAAKKAIN